MNKWASVAIWVVFSFFLMAAFVLSATLPPVRVDELVYHLVIPRHYLAHGGVTEMPWNIYSYFPGLMEILFAFFLKSGVISPQIAHCIFGIGCCWATQLLASRFGLRRPYQWMAVFAVLLTPEFFKEMTWAYVDLANAFFWTMGFLFFLKWSEQRKTVDLIWMGVAAAGACSIKYTSLIYPLILSLLILLELRRGSSSVSWVRYVRGILAAMVVFAALTSWWWIRNWVWTGNPLFPFLSEIFPSQHPYWGEDRIQLFMMFVHQYGGTGHGDLWNRLINAPQLFFTIVPAIGKRFDGIYNLWLIAGFGSLFFLRKCSALRALWFFVLIQGIFWICSSQQTRFALVLVPFLAVAAAYVVQESQFRYPRGMACCGALFILLSCINAGSLYNYFSKNGCFTAVFSGDQETYLRERLPYWQVYRYIHKNTAENAVIGMVLTGAQVYYLERDYRTDTVFEEYTLVQMIKKSSCAEDVIAQMRAAGWDYMLTYLPVYQSPIWLEKEHHKILPEILKKLTLVYTDRGYCLFKIPSSMAQPTTARSEAHDGRNGEPASH
ncbi:MAG: phospholipid carrier-dependent glycosyltransferase [Bacteroidetes bacterium]|nr:phospholipid carrier-dependent glycosyltransferase [Bacteroidota bacterium]